MVSLQDVDTIKRLEKEAMWDNFYRAYDAVGRPFHLTFSSR